MDNTQKRWSFIVNVIYLLIFAAAFYLFMRYAFWTLAPFLVAFLIAAILQKPMKWLTKSKKSPKGIISVVLSLLVFGIIGALIAFCGARLVYTIKDLISYFTDRCTNLAEFFEVLKTGYLGLDLAQRLPAEVNDSIISGIDSVSDYLTSGAILDTLTNNFTKVVSPIGSVISTVPSVLLGFLICVISTCFMTSSFAEMKAFILRQFPDEKKEKAVRAKHILVSSVGKMCKAYAAIILITTAELFIGLSILKLIGVNDGAHTFTVSLLIALIDIVPVLGTGTVVIPWSLYSFVTGNIGMGIGLLILYAVITVIRQVIEPKLVAGQVGISPVVTIMAMYVGIKLFGAIGIFILPFFVIILKLLNDEGIIHIFRSSEKHDQSVQPQDSAKSDASEVTEPKE